jgi:hypothetical protein
MESPNSILSLSSTIFPSIPTKESSHQKSDLFAAKHVPRLFVGKKREKCMVNQPLGAVVGIFAACPNPRYIETHQGHLLEVD